MEEENLFYEIYNDGEFIPLSVLPNDKGNIIINLNYYNKGNVGIINCDNLAFNFNYSIIDIDKHKQRKIFDLIEYEIKFNSSLSKEKIKFNSLKLVFKYINEDNKKKTQNSESIIKEFNKNDLDKYELGQQSNILILYKLLLKKQKGKLYLNKVIFNLCEKENIFYEINIPSELDKTILLTGKSINVLNFKYPKKLTSVGINQLFTFEYEIKKQKVNKIAKNDNSDEDLSLNNDNKDDNEIKDENNINQNKNNIENRISKKKEQNEAYKSRILSALNSNTKMKDNLKNMILTQNKKLFFCLVCNTLLEKTLLDKSTCNFDSNCTSRSFFFCKKCKIHFCTKCIIYQRGLKCFQNHKYFPKPVNTNEDIKCFLCNKSKIFPYYECKYCKEQICSECSEGVNVRQNSCQNCNNELIWKKCLFTVCDKCHKLSECFYFCICCENSICLNCSNNPKGKCGALHDLEKIELNSDKPDKDILFDNKKRFSNYYEALIDGKCSLCNITIGKNIVWACLRCSLFLCDKCFKRIDEN
jgi:hypothetical protein